MATIGTKLFTWLFAKQVGVDKFGNRYYVAKSRNAEGKYRRSVIYNGIPEPTKVPPMWHGWLHYMTDILPVDDQPHSWQRQAMPNVTGTSHAYHPSQHNKISAVVSSWQPIVKE